MKSPLALSAKSARPHRALHYLGRFYNGLMDHDAFEAAASIAFWFFLSLVPLLVLVGFLVGHVARTRGVDTLVGPLLEIVPGSAEGLVRKELERLAGANAAPLAPLGVGGFLWTASSGLHALMDVFEKAVPVERRPWWKQRAIAFACVVIGLAAACAVAWVLTSVDSAFQTWDTALAPPASSTVPGASPPHVGEHSPVRAAAGPRAREAIPKRVHKTLAPKEQALAAIVVLVAGMGLLAGFYRFAVEHPAKVRRRVWPGTVAALASWLIVSWAFGAYAVSIADYALYYGSLAAVAVLLVWLYLTSLSLVVGAEVNALLEKVTG
jgi:membrane protein